jgi:UrcA family protein
VKTFAPFVLALSLLAPALAQAATAGDEFRAVRVSHADLTLDRSRDAAIMLRRLETASLNACGASTFSARQFQDEVRASACYRQSLDRAVADLGAPTVTELARSAR